MIEVFNDFRLVKIIDVFWSKGDPVRLDDRSDWVLSPTVPQWLSRGLELVHP